jgi:uncharacterized protein (TIGR03083 family)
LNQSPTALPLATDTYLTVLREKAAAFERLLRTADPDTAVPTCGGRSLRDLGAHLGHVYRFGAAVARTGEPWCERFAPSAGEPIADRYAQGAASLPAVLERADPTKPTWAFGFKDAVPAFWFRRLAQDTTVHLADARPATGAEARIDPRVAADGVDEVLTVMIPTVWPGGKAKPLPAPVVLRTTGTGHGWLIQPADIPQVHPADSRPAAATVEATAADLLLTLWKRGPARPEWISGDVAADALLSAPLTL